MKKLIKKKKFDERRNEILNTTMLTLANEGCSAVSMRGIADRVGIHLSTLQYYFPTKRELLKSTIEKSIGSMVRLMDDMMSNSTLEPGKVLQKALKVHLAACHDPTIARLFVELWSMANHDEDANQLLSEIYKRDCQRYAILIQNANPSLSKISCENRAVLIVAQLEGLVLFISPGKPFASKTRVIEKQLWTLIDKFIA